MTDLSGQYLGRYHLLEQLGEGGMAVVYKAFDTRLEREVAVKIIRSVAFPPELLGDVLKRFEREAKSLARLSHPNIVRVHDYGEHEGAPYLVMEYLAGGTLKEVLGKPIAWQDAVPLILPIARGVVYAHQRGILHRDIKPANILVTEDNEPRLSDFGIAKLFEGEQTTALTRSGMAIGTPEYMAPEQWTGQTSPQSDLYSLGIVLYEMVAGRKPYAADTPAAILIKQATEPLPSPRKFAADLPEMLEYILIKALAKAPADRYQDMKAFVTALENLQLAMPAVHPPVHAVTEEMHKATLPVPEPDLSIPTQVTMQDGGEAVLPAATSESQKAVEPSLLITPETKPAPPSKFSRRGIAALFGVSAIALVAIFWVLSPNLFSASNVPTTQTATLSLSTLTASPSPSPTDTITPTATALPTEIADAKGVSLRLIPEGTFAMGDDNGALEEKPAHLVYLDAFYMDKYEVTNALYKVCVETDVCQPPTANNSRTRPSYYGNTEFDQYPVMYVDWSMAQTYCDWRGGHLPTEAQWEKAARGTDGRTHPWGAGLDETFTNYDENVGDTTAVGSYEKDQSPYGIYDMGGNVLEWVADWYDPGYYATLGDNAVNPPGPSSGYERVLRGNSWTGSDLTARSSVRLVDVPPYNFDIIGFRCAMDVKP